MNFLGLISLRDFIGAGFLQVANIGSLSQQTGTSSLKRVGCGLHLKAREFAVRAFVELLLADYCVIPCSAVLVRNILVAFLVHSQPEPVTFMI